MKINSGQAPSTLVPKYIGSDFDHVVTVGKNIEDVKTVAGAADDMEVVIDNLGSVATIATNIGEVVNVSGNMEYVRDVAGAVEDVGVVVDNLGSVTAVATNIGDVVSVSDNMDYVKDVAAGIAGLPVISYIGEEPPTQPEVGSSWYCTADGRTYVWYKDIDSFQWVESSPQSAPLDLQDVRKVAIANADRQMKLLGYDLVKGSFEEGALLSKSTDVVLYKHTGVVYKCKGVFPAQIPANSSPIGTGISNWEEVVVPVMGASVMEALRRSYAEAGYNLVDGSFEAGGTLVNANDVLLQERTGKAFSGPVGVVAAGTNPASGGFVDRSLSTFAATTVQILGTGAYGVGAKVELIDRAYARFEVVSGGTPDGYIVLNAGSGNTAVYVNSGMINVEHFGAVADCWLDAAHTQPNPTPTDNTAPFEKALSLQGTLEIPFRPNGYMYSSRLNFSDRVVHGNGATLVPHNFSDEYSATFHNAKVNDLKFKPRDWGVNSFNGRPYLVTFTSVLDRCDFTAYQKSQLFFDGINVQPYYTEHRECRFRYFKEHNIVIKQGANLIKFFGGITGWAGSPAYMQPPTVEGVYDGLITMRDSSPEPIGPYTPESLVVLGMDGSYNSRYGFNFDKLSFANITTGYTEGNLKKAMRLGDIIGSSILANKISDEYDNNIPLIDWNNAEGVGRYHNRIVVNGQSIGSGARAGAGLRALNFELAHSQTVLVKQGCYPILTGTQAGYVQLTCIFPQTYAEFQLDENFNLKSTRKGHDIQTRTHEFNSTLPAPAGYDKTFAWLRATGELYFCNPVYGWRKVSLV